VTARVSPTERIRAEIDQLFAADRDLGEVLEDVARLGARLLLQAALEAEVAAFLGRECYARGERARAGHRNGHQPVTVKTTPARSPLTAQAARHRPGVLLAAAGQARDPHPRAGVAGHRRLCARAV
jgi:putative transposase